MSLPDDHEDKLADNPTFYRALVEVVIEPSEIGLTVWDSQGRFIVIAPEQLRDYDLGDWSEEDIAIIRRNAAQMAEQIRGLVQED